ncbi:hypothetical protein CGRA01v4_11034 [Colletotrichum graminicola]|nr:hypothetical protein CGRA01v4_11034 [Colletotrichum graminicola]
MSFVLGRHCYIEQASIAVSGRRYDTDVMEHARHSMTDHPSLQTSIPLTMCRPYTVRVYNNTVYLGQITLETPISLFYFRVLINNERVFVPTYPPAAPTDVFIPLLSLISNGLDGYSNTAKTLPPSMCAPGHDDYRGSRGSPADMSQG